MTEVLHSKQNDLNHQIKLPLKELQKRTKNKMCIHKFRSSQTKNVNLETIAFLNLHQQTQGGAYPNGGKPKAVGLFALN